MILKEGTEKPSSSKKTRTGGKGRDAILDL